MFHQEEARPKMLLRGADYYPAGAAPVQNKIVPRAVPRRYKQKMALKIEEINYKIENLVTYFVCTGVHFLFVPCTGHTQRPLVPKKFLVKVSGNRSLCQFLTNCFLLPRFLDKFTEFLTSFVKSHLRRFESNDQFPILSFLSMLFKYTFEQQRTESYLACLDVWNICVDYVTGLISSRTPDADVIVSKYREAFLSIIVDVLKQMQFRCVPTRLDEMDDEDFDDDEETEWQHYLRASIECIMKVAEVFPNDVLRIVVSTYWFFFNVSSRS
jgi:hypothetical protein